MGVSKSILFVTTIHFNLTLEDGMDSNFIIEPVDNSVEMVLPLIRAYQEFYGVILIDDEKNRQFFNQFGPNNPTGIQFVAKVDDKPVGFATLYYTFVSTIASKIGVMSDLYVDPQFRGKGVGKALIEQCRDRARENGCARIQWLTAPDNETAQRLYESLPTKKSSWNIFVYPV